MLFIFYAIFRLLLDASYYLFVSQVFEYEGYGFNFIAATYFISWLIYLASFFMASGKFNKVSDYFFVIAVLSVIAPLTSLYGLSGRSIFPLVVTLASLYFVFVITKYGRFGSSSIYTIKDGNKIAVGVSVVAVLYLVVWYFATGAAFNLNLNFSKVYEFRDINSELSDVGVLAYLNSWVLQVFSIFVISYFLHRRKILIALLFVGIQVFFFSVSSHKSVLLYPFMIFAIWFYFSKYSSMVVVPISFTAIVALSLSLFLFLDELYTGSLFIRRVFFVPALLTYGYFDFFSEHAYIYWSNSVFAGFVKYPYSDRVTILIGQSLGSTASANNGFISSGYAHAGLIGVAFYSVLLGLILNFIDNISRNTIPLWFALAITVIPLRNILISSDLLTALLTHGLIVAVLLLVFMRRKFQD